MGTNRLCDIYEGSHLWVQNGIGLIHADYCVCYAFVLLSQEDYLYCTDSIRQSSTGLQNRCCLYLLVTRATHFAIATYAITL